MKDAIAIGAHLVGVEADVVRVEHHGLLSLSEIQKTFELVSQWQKERGVQYMIVDMQRMAPLEPEVRKWIAQNAKTLSLRAMLAVGASPVVRIMATMVDRAVKILWHKHTMVFLLLKTEEEALAWIEADRKKPRDGPS